jgi:15-cis-phytoene synthase
MHQHAKSFYLASLFFPRHLLPKVKALYALCRWLDDAVDEAPSVPEAQRRLQVIESDLALVNPELEVNQIYKDCQLPVSYMSDLISGAREDLNTVRIQNQDELIQYCYKVAGTVGLAMYELMSVNNPSARAHAVDLGIAMQITNICRDVKEDLARDRIYIPKNWLLKQQIDSTDLLKEKVDPQLLKPVILQMLDLADHYYLSAEQAFASIPWRSRGAIIIAARLYRAIGVKLRRLGANPLLGRTYLTRLEKMVVVAGALGSWFKSFFGSTQPKSHQEDLHLPLKNWRTLRGF